jgi:hypothetical protein
VIPCQARERILPEPGAHGARGACEERRQQPAGDDADRQSTGNGGHVARHRAIAVL